MAKVLFSKKGTPLIGYGNSSIITTTGAPEKPKTLSKDIDQIDDALTINNYKISPWGDENDFPQKADTIIGKTGVLNTGLKFIRNFTLGQGIYPVKVTGYDDDGNETLEVIQDPVIQKLLRSRMIRRYLEKALRDYLKFGPAMPQLLPNSDASKIVGINTINAKHCRFTEAKNGVIENCLVSGKWPEQPTDKAQYEIIPVLDDYDPNADLQRRRYGKKIVGKSFIYPLKDSWSNEDYYSRPAWWSAYLAGWIDIANKVPQFLKTAYKHQISWQWHVQIPYTYWDRKYPENEFKNIKERQEAIQKEMDDIEKCLTGEENANKALFSMFEINPNSGKAEEQWMITSLDNKYKEGDKLFTSAAANSEILFSLMLNPNVLGAGMPGGTYAGNQGGSNIREAFLVNIANAWLDRQNLLDPIECMLEYNGVKDIELRFRNTILTTLDTGAGTKDTF